MKQNATISADANDLTKQEHVQHRSASSRTRHLAQVNGSQEKIGNVPLQTSNDEEQSKLLMSNYKETNENGMEEDKTQQQSAERSDQSMSEFAGSQAEAAEMT